MGGFGSESPAKEVQEMVVSQSVWPLVKEDVFGQPQTGRLTLRLIEEANHFPLFPLLLVSSHA